MLLVIPDPVFVPTGVVFDSAISGFSGHGDNHFMTWAQDDNIYVSVNDGWGWPATGLEADNYNNRVWRLKGPIHGFTPEKLIGYPDRKPSNSNYYGYGIIALGNNLYHWITRNEHITDHFEFIGNYLVYSDDLGATWKNQDGSAMSFDETPGSDTAFWWDTPAKCFSLTTVCQMGKNYEHNTDGYFYICAPNGNVDGKMNQLVMARVPVANVLTKASYEYCSGVVAGVPSWSSNIADRSPIHTFPSTWIGTDYRYSWMPSMIYNAKLGIYLMAAAGTGKDNSWIFNSRSYLGIWKADNPWGPWTQIHENLAWGWVGGDPAYATAEEKRSYLPQLCPKNISPDGKRLWMVYSDITTWFDGVDPPNIGPAPYPENVRPNYKHIVVGLTLT